MGRKLNSKIMGNSNVKVNQPKASSSEPPQIKVETISMTDISGLEPVEKRGKVDCRFMYTFLSGVIGEYVLGLPQDEMRKIDAGFWSPFRGEGETERWYHSLDRFDFLKDLLDSMDFSGDRESFVTLSSKITFTMSGGNTTIAVGDLKFAVTGSILRLQKIDKRNICFVFSKVSGDPKLLPIGKIKDLKVNAIDVPDVIPVNQSSDSQEHQLLMTEDEFFGSTDDLRNLDKDQRMVVSADTDKDLLVVAGAGSGKTRSLVGRICYLNMVRGVPLERIQVLTFMREATFPVINSVSDQLKEFYPLGVEERGSVKVNTIDAFFKHLVDDYWSDIGFTNKPVYGFESDNIKTDVLRNIMLREFGKKMDDEGLESLRFQLENHANGLIVNIPGIEVILRDYLDWQVEQCTILDFFCISLLLRNALERDDVLLEKICSIYDCILIDEFQDINRLQNSVFNRMYGKGIHFTFVGDDDQTIYTWRGSDNSIIRGIQNKEDVHTICLTTNYRNNPHIVRAGNAILKELEGRAKEKDEIVPYEKKGLPIRITEVSWDYADMANEIGKLYDPSPDADRICVLCRNSRNMNDVKKALEDISVPAVIIRNRSGNELSFGYTVFKSLVMIARKVDVKANYDILRELAGDVCSNTELKSFIHGKKQFEGSEKTISDIIKLSKYTDTTFQSLDSFEDLITSYNRGYAREIESDQTPERMTEDECLSSFQEFISENEWPYPDIDPKVLSSIFYRFERYYLGRRSVRDKVGGDMNVVTISTIHSAKGLEYDSVFIINMDDGTFPNTKRIDRDHSNCLRELNDLESSRRALDRIKSSMNRGSVEAIISECTPENLPEIDPDDISSMIDDLNDDADSLLSVSADGVKEYREIFEYYLGQVLDGIRTSINDLNQKKRVIEEEYGKREEELLSIDSDVVSNDELDSLQSEIDVKRDEISKEEEKLREFRRRIEKSESMYSLCNKVQNLLFDVEKLNDASRIKTQLEMERREKVFEEKRIFYVAMSRARKLLYLCTSCGSRPSEFIRIIPTEECENYRMTTRIEDKQREALRRFKMVSSSEMRRREPDADLLQKAATELKEALPDSIRGSYDEFYRGFVEKYPIFSKLTDDAKRFFETAVFLDHLTKMGLMKLYNEVLLNLQRCGEMLLRSHIDVESFDPVVMSEDEALEIQKRISKLMETRRTNPPGRDYVKNLFSGDGYMDRTEFKSLAIQYYAVFGYLEGDPYYADNWDISSLGIDADEFIAVSCDLCNIRNKGVHGKKADIWETDPVPYAYECLGKMIEAL